MATVSRLASLLRDGRFVVTAELSSSNSADPDATWRRAEVLRGSVDAINCTDNTGAHVHMSSLAASHLLVEKGLEPVMQLTVRDRNRLALQADLLGAAALGIHNLVLMSGDDVTAGDHPEARRIYVVQDNWSIHSHVDVQTALADLPQIEPVWLPTYAPWLNPIEKLWRWLREQVLTLHRLAGDWQALRERVNAFLSQFAEAADELLHYVGLLGEGKLAQALCDP